MARELQRLPTYMDRSQPEATKEFDDDGRLKRSGTLLTASAHIITAVIGSGVLSLAWAMAQLGWIVGPIALLAFSVITWFCSLLLADCYRYPDPVTGTRNYTYMDAVKKNLGGTKFKLCGLAQYVNLVGLSMGYTITTAVSMAAVKKSHCFYKNGHDAACHVSYNAYMIGFAAIQIVLSQLPNIHKLWWLSIVAAVMSFSYASIGLGLSIARIAESGHEVRTTLTGATVGVDVSASDKFWRTFQSLGNIAFAYTYSNVLIEIQDTLKSSPPENQVMKKASSIGVTATTTFYMLCGLLGYAAFGNNTQGNLLTGFGFYDPYWLVDIGNICIAIHLVGAYQVFCHPFFQFVEKICRECWPGKGFITNEKIIKLPLLGDYPFSFFKLIWRTIYVIFTMIMAMIVPFFNDILGLIGALAFWPLTVYFPIEMYIVRAKVQRFSVWWSWLNLVSFGCLVVSVLAAFGSIQGLAQSLKIYKPFNN